MQLRRKKTLYRRVNTRAHHVHHKHGADYRHVRNSKHEKCSSRKSGPMARGVSRGLDYTPLFKFLLSKIGEDWDEVSVRPKADLIARIQFIGWSLCRTNGDKSMSDSERRVTTVDCT